MREVGSYDGNDESNGKEYEEGVEKWLLKVALYMALVIYFCLLFTYICCAYYLL
jgi:hypothetical protein